MTTTGNLSGPLESADKHLGTGKVAARYDVTTMTIWRWTKDENLGFPKPLKINTRKYWRESDLIAWERARARCAA